MTSRYKAAAVYDLGDTAIGSDGVEYESLTAVNIGVDPVVNAYPAGVGDKWKVREFRIPNGYVWMPPQPPYKRVRGLEGLANTGWCTAQRWENIASYDWQGLNFGPQWRPDIPIDLRGGPLNKWWRDDDVQFGGAPWGFNQPHANLILLPAGYAAGMTQVIDTTTHLSPELKVSTGANSGAGCDFDFRYSPAAFYPRQSWNWVFRVTETTKQRITLGVRSTDNENRAYFVRNDMDVEKSWVCWLGRNDDWVRYDTGLKTGTERIWFCIDHGAESGDDDAENVVRFWIGSITGECQYGSNELLVRATWPPSSAPDPTAIVKPYMRFQNTDAVDRELYLWRAWFNLL